MPKLYARWRKPDKEDYIVWSHLCEIYCKGKSTEIDSSLEAVIVVGENELTANGHEGSSWDDKNVLNLDYGCTT